MPMLTIRNIPDEVHRALRVRSAQHGISMEAEVREILRKAVMPEERVKLGSLLANIGREVKLTEDEFQILESVRDRSPLMAIATRDEKPFKAIGLRVINPWKSSSEI